MDKSSNSNILLIFMFSDQSSGECVDFKIIYNKQKFDVSFPLDKTASELKVHVQSLTGNLENCC